MATRYILSVDGGGVYGVIPATWCVAIERETGKSMKALFDFMAGTSTGSVLGAGFATDHRAEEVLELYMDRGKDIFKNPRSFLRQVFRPKYQAKFLIGVLEEFFHDTKLGEVDPLRLMLTAYEMNTNEPRFFKSWEPHEKDIRILDAVVASSSAPTTHPMHKVRVKRKDGGIADACLVDGGVFAVDPALCALADARSEEPAWKAWENDEIVLVSLGTGYFDEGVTCTKATRRWGLLRWAPRIPSVFLEGQHDVVKYQITRLMSYLRVTYFRFDVALEDPKHADETDRALLEKAQRLAEGVAQSTDFKKMIALLKGPAVIS